MVYHYTHSSYCITDESIEMNNFIIHNYILFGKVISNDKFKDKFNLLAKMCYNIDINNNDILLLNVDKQTMFIVTKYYCCLDKVIELCTNYNSIDINNIDFTKIILYDNFFKDRYVLPNEKKI
jgi:hypothetical protein